jgi:hypothetical protein
MTEERAYELLNDTITESKKWNCYIVNLTKFIIVYMLLTRLDTSHLN